MAQSDGSHDLLSLPAELIYSILVHLQPIDLANLACTCRRLKSQAYDDQIWLPIVNENLPEPLSAPTPLPTFRELYVAHHPHWFLPRHKIWFADAGPSGKLLMARYDPRRGCIEAYTMLAVHGRRTVQMWEHNPLVMIHSFDPNIRLDLNQPVLKLDVNCGQQASRQSRDDGGIGLDRRSRYAMETAMETFSDAGLYSSFMLCRKLPQTAIDPGTSVWPPRLIPAKTRVRNESGNGYKSAGHQPKHFGEVSQHSFRLRKWVEYSGRRSSSSILSINTPLNGLSAAISMAAPYFTAGMTTRPGSGVSVRMPEDVTTYATMDPRVYTPTKEKPYRGIFCGDYSGHGCEFLLINQPDEGDEIPLPVNMDWLRSWFQNGRRASLQSDESDENAQDEFYDFADPNEAYDDAAASRTAVSRAEQAATATDMKDAPTGRLEGIKLTGDPNIPRGEYSFVAPDIGTAGFMRVADEDLFKGARVVRSAGHLADRGFRDDQYTPSQLILLSPDQLAQFWEGFGHISYYQRVDLDALLKL